MIRNIHLHGRLGRIFGKLHRLETATAGEVVRALNAIFPGKFMEELKIGSYQVIRGRRHGGLHLGEGDLNSLNLGRGDLHIVPVVAGSKKSGGKGKGGGALKAILGVVLIGAAIFFSGGTLAAPLAGMSAAVPGLSVAGMSITWGNIALFGVAATLAGASQLLSTPEKTEQKEAESSSFALNGPASTFGQGNPIPVIAGVECIVGSQPISVSSSVGDIAIG